MNVFEFVLFAILGWCVFAWFPSPPPPAKNILMIVFVVLMVIWAVTGLTGYSTRLTFPTPAPVVR